MTADFLCGCGISATSPAPRCRACPQAQQVSVAQQVPGAQYAAGQSSAAGQFGSVAQQGTPQPAAQFGSLAPPPLPDRPQQAPLVQPGGHAALVRYSRWEKSQGTFGPFGRLFATFLLLLPLPIFAMTLAIGIGIIGAGIYLVVVMPWALRDIWKKATIRLEVASGAPTAPRF